MIELSDNAIAARAGLAERLTELVEADTRVARVQPASGGSSPR
jgi:hypothetical protein